MDIKRIVGLNVNLLRLSKELTQEEFAREIGISRAQVSRIESANQIPSAEIIKNICIKFNVSADWLLGNDKNSFFLDYDSFDFLQLYSGLSDEHKRIVINLMKVM